jgi:putative endonuclease
MGWLYRAAGVLRRRAMAGNSGRIGEDLAHRYLRKHGCTVVARNYRTRSGSGEIDVVAWDGVTLVFVEVKTRQSGEFGEPERAVDPEKERRLRGAGRDYARRAGVEWERTRFDIVSVVLKPRRIEWLRDAFR